MIQGMYFMTRKGILLETQGILSQQDNRHFRIFHQSMHGYPFSLVGTQPLLMKTTDYMKQPGWEALATTPS